MDSAVQEHNDENHSVEQDELTKFLLNPNLSDLSELHGEVILVDWRDAHHDHISDWTTIDNIEFPETIIQSVGFLIKEDEHHIMLAASKVQRAEEDVSTTVCGFFTITKNQIIDIKRIDNDAT
jgi:hypothetical protein